MRKSKNAQMLRKLRKLRKLIKNWICHEKKYICMELLTKPLQIQSVSGHKSNLSIVTPRVHFFGKIQNRIIAWDYTDSFLRKKQNIRKGINCELIPAKETKNPKNGFFHLYSLLLVLLLRPLTTWTFFESFPKETQKSWILRIRIRINPLNLHRVWIHWIHNPFLDFAKETINPNPDSESGLGFFPKKCTPNFRERGVTEGV